MMVRTNQSYTHRYYTLAREKYSQFPALFSKDENGQFKSMTHTELWQEVKLLGAGLLSLGVSKNDRIGLISDNRKEWIMSNLAILSIGAVDVPRGSDATDRELIYIIDHAACGMVFLENRKQLERILYYQKDLPGLHTVVLLENDPGAISLVPKGLNAFTLAELSQRGEEMLKEDSMCFERRLSEGKREDLCSIIYTSGTTGEPKGVMLTHQSFLVQVEELVEIVSFDHKDCIISVLPVWHSFERAVEYVALFYGASIVYSKPLSSILLKDIELTQPTFFPSVPRIWESVYGAILSKIRKGPLISRLIFHLCLSMGNLARFCNDRRLNLLPSFSIRSELSITLEKTFFQILYVFIYPLRFIADLLVFGKIRKRFGKNFRAGISGAGALPPHIDDFFRTAGIKILEGYGMTEMGPVMSVRNIEHPRVHTTGSFIRSLRFKVVNENGQSVGVGEKGELWVKSPQMMTGYYKRPDKTQETITEDGWLKTGDLVIKTMHDEISIIGRKKDTIVLSGGKNIEPEPIETKILESEFIDQVVVVGQDKKFLGALIVPHLDNLQSWRQKQKLPTLSAQEIIESKETKDFFQTIIASKINEKNGFHKHEAVFRIKILEKPFEVDKELTKSLKLKRNVIFDLYAREITQLFS